MATSRIWDYPRGLRHHLHEAVRWSFISGLASSPTRAAVREAVRSGTVAPPAGFTAEEVITNITTGC